MVEHEVSKEHWNEILKISRRKLVQVFLAGAIVSTIIWWIVFYVFIKTGFRL